MGRTGRKGDAKNSRRRVVWLLTMIFMTKAGSAQEIDVEISILEYLGYGLIRIPKDLSPY
jgi:hypothetical protein